MPAPIGPGQPPGTFDYHWKTFGWPATAGVWLYHDHSICADQNVNQGAIGALVIHTPHCLQSHRKASKGLASCTRGSRPMKSSPVLRDTLRH